MNRAAILAPLLLSACRGDASPKESTAPDSGTVDSADSSAPETGDTDTGAATPECDPSGLGAYSPVPVDTYQIPPSLTAQGGETIDDTLQGTYKAHYVQRRADGGYDRQELFVWLGGSGGEPQNYDYILNMVAFAGYVGVSLAFDNETSVGDLCAGDSPECSEANVDCEEQVREEMITGADTSPCLEITEANSIQHRLLRLVQYAVTVQPDAGFERYLDATQTELDWTHIAVGGWSQGGGHAGMLARDHLVARALYVSKGAGSVTCTDLHTEEECDTDHSGAVDTLDEYVVPAPWVDEPRMTPGSREFGAIHMEEDAWLYSRETFATYGMEGADAPLVIDGLGPYPDAWTATYGCTHVFANDFVPACGDTDFHKSMASDSCMALDDDGVPLLAPAYVYALTLPVE